MSKIAELIKRKEAAEQDHEEVLAKTNVELTEINDALDKLVHEFIKKVKAPFRGVKLYVKCDERGVDVFLGKLPEDPHRTRSGICVLQYNKDIYICNTEFITSEIGAKIKALHIEYFGEL